jgi:hypothetical protein
MWCDGLSIFILIEAGSSVSPGPNSTPNTGHKRDISEVHEDLQVTSIKSSAYLLCHANANVLHRSPEGCSAGLHFQSTFLDDNDKIVSVPLCPDHSKNARFAICMCEDSGHYAGCAKHSCQTCPMPECTYLQIASDFGRQTPTLWHCSRVCKLRTANQVAFYTWQSLSHTTALPINRLRLEMELHVNSFHGEIHAESL